jgi:hypothetical protein
MADGRSSSVTNTVEYQPEQQGRASVVVGVTEYQPEQQGRTSLLVTMVEYTVLAKASAVVVFTEYNDVPTTDDALFFGCTF